MDARAVAGLAIGIDRAAVPDGAFSASIGDVAAVADRPDDQRGAAHDVAGGEDAVRLVIMLLCRP
jgi:hypothetical protein